MDQKAGVKSQSNVLKSRSNCGATPSSVPLRKQIVRKTPRTILSSARRITSKETSENCPKLPNTSGKRRLPSEGSSTSLSCVHKPCKTPSLYSVDSKLSNSKFGDSKPRRNRLKTWMDSNLRTFDATGKTKMISKCPRNKSVSSLDTTPLGKGDNKFLGSAIKLRNEKGALEKSNQRDVDLDNGMVPFTPSSEKCLNNFEGTSTPDGSVYFTPEVVQGSMLKPCKKSCTNVSPTDELADNVLPKRMQKLKLEEKEHQLEEEPNVSIHLPAPSSSTVVEKKVKAGAKTSSIIEKISPEEKISKIRHSPKRPNVFKQETGAISSLPIMAHFGKGDLAATIYTARVGRNPFLLN